MDPFEIQPRQPPERLGHGQTVIVNALGRIEAVVDEQLLTLGGQKQRTVLALLVASAGTAASSDTLIQGVRGDDPPSGVSRSLSVYLSKLRSEFGVVVHRPGKGYVLEVDREAVDAYALEDMVIAANGLSPQEPSEMLRDGLAMWPRLPVCRFRRVHGTGPLGGQGSERRWIDGGRRPESRRRSSDDSATDDRRHSIGEHSGDVARCGEGEMGGVLSRRSGTDPEESHGRGCHRCPKGNGAAQARGCRLVRTPTDGRLLAIVERDRTLRLLDIAELNGLIEPGSEAFAAATRWTVKAHGGGFVPIIRFDGQGLADPGQATSPEPWTVSPGPLCDCWEPGRVRRKLHQHH